MPDPIVYVDTSTVREGKHEELKRAMSSLTQFVEKNVPRVLSYAFYLDEEENQMTVVALHPDSSSLQFHLDVGADEFAKFADLIDLERIEVYGSVSVAVRERLQRKAQGLGSGAVNVHDFHVGFRR